MNEITLDDLEPNMHVMYENMIGISHGARVEKLPPWTDASGNHHDDDTVLLRRPDERVVHASIDDITEITPLNT